MTDTTTTTDPPEADAAQPDFDGAVGPALDAPEDEVKEAWKTRAILPLALPFLAVIATMVWVVNLSRAFLAGGKEGALIIVLIVTVAIMVGAALVSAARRMRQSSHLLVTSALVVLIIAAGFISLGPSEGHGETASSGYQQPTGPAVATIEVDALGSNRFQADAFTTQAGINEIQYIAQGGTHTLAFTDPKFAGFLLEVPPDDSGKVDLAAGEYIIYCTIPGHRASGMEATITVQ